MCGLAALAELEDQYTTLDELMAAAADVRDRKRNEAALHAMGVAFAKCAAMADGRKLTDEERKAADKWDSLAVISADPVTYIVNKRMIKAAMAEGFVMKYIPPDERKDKYLRAANEKKRSKKKGNKSRISVDEIYSFGLIAGITITEARTLRPGFICDCYRRRLEYDAAGMGGGVGQLLTGKKRR